MKTSSSALRVTLPNPSTTGTCLLSGLSFPGPGFWRDFDWDMNNWSCGGAPVLPVAFDVGCPQVLMVMYSFLCPCRLRRPRSSSLSPTSSSSLLKTGEGSPDVFGDNGPSNAS